MTAASRSEQPIADFMTPSPPTIDCGCSIAEAREVIAAEGVRHLPVLDRGALVGVASACDLDRLQLGKPNVEPEVLAVAEAMKPQPFIVDPAMPVSRVIARMVDEGLNVAVVVDQAHVVGVFNSRDALRLLSELLDDETSSPLN